MPVDGEMDYRTLSPAQLREALSNIDADRYPRNYARLVEELNSRPTEPPKESVLPDSLVISTLQGMQIEFAFCLFIVAIGICLGVALILWPDFLAQDPRRSVFNGIPPNSRGWFLAVVFVILGSLGARRARRSAAVTLMKDQLVVTGWQGSEQMSLDRVTDVRVVNTNRSGSCVGRIDFDRDTFLGRSIRLTANSVDRIDQLRAIVEFRRRGMDARTP